jgi:hypothetical protein
MKVNHINKFVLKKHLKNLKKCFSYKKNKIAINNPYLVNKIFLNDNNDIGNSNNSKQGNESQNEKKSILNKAQKVIEQEKVSSKNNKCHTEHSRNKEKIYDINFSQTPFNYNYPISHDENSFYFSQFLSSRYSKENKLI